MITLRGIPMRLFGNQLPRWTSAPRGSPRPEGLGRKSRSATTPDPGGDGQSVDPATLGGQHSRRVPLPTQAELSTGPMGFSNEPSTKIHLQQMPPSLDGIMMP